MSAPEPIQHADSPSIARHDAEPKPKKPKKETAAERKARHARRPTAFLVKKARAKLDKAHRNNRSSAISKAAAALAALLQKR